MESRLINSLDELNAAEFRQLQMSIGSDYATVDPKRLKDRLKSVEQYQSVLFYISIDSPNTNERIFRSANLEGHEIPDVKGQRRFSAEARGLGPLRINEFLLPPYDVTVATSELSVHESTRAFAIISALLIGLMLVVSTVLGLAFARFVLSPIRVIRDTAQRIGSDNLAERIPVAEVRDEVDELAVLLNTMFDRLELSFGQMSRFSEQVSHELKTPLSLIRLHAESVAKNASSPHNAEAAVEQIEEIARLNTFIDQMLFLSRAESNAIAFDLQPVNPAPFMQLLAHDAEALADHSGHRFEFEATGQGTVRIEVSWMRQVLLNVISNALNASPPGGLVRMESVFSDSFWQVSIEDDGPGLAAADCARIFERFVRIGGQRRGDRGAGLGLSIARSIVTLHLGTMHAEPRENATGLRVVIALPAAETSNAGDQPAQV
ncbi:MAG: ATP-binding protein [Novosphingobium sp.]